MPYEVEIDLQFPERKFGRIIKFADDDATQSLHEKIRAAQRYIAKSPTASKQLVWSVWALRRRIRPLSIAERKVMECREAKRRAIDHAIEHAEGLSETSTEELKLLVSNPDVQPLVSLMAENILRNRND